MLSETLFDHVGDDRLPVEIRCEGLLGVASAAMRVTHCSRRPNGRSCAVSRCSPAPSRSMPRSRSSPEGDHEKVAVIEAIAALVAKSLIQTSDRGGSLQYRLLDTT